MSFPKLSDRRRRRGESVSIGPNKVLQGSENFQEVAFREDRVGAVVKMQ
jgi:hypothetical protein